MQNKVNLGLYYLKTGVRKLDHGFSEAPTMYNGEETGEKVILDSAGQFIRTVGAGFTLLTHEMLEQKIKDAGFDIYYSYYSSAKGLSKAPRRATFEVGSKNNIKTTLLIHNSIDGSAALTVYVKIGNSILSGETFKRVYKMHTENLEADDIVKACQSVLQHASQFDELMKTLNALNISGNKDMILEMQKKMLLDGMPKKYAQDVIDKAILGMGGMVTLEHLYSELSRQIWSSDVDMQRKINLFNILNDYMFAATISATL